MPLIAFVGDIHGEAQKMYGSLLTWQEAHGDTKIDAVVQVGDFGIYRTGTTWSSMFAKGQAVPIPTWVCPGNHESPVAIRDWQENPGKIPNMHLMPDGEIADVLGVQIGAVWGNYSPISWLDSQRVRRNRRDGENERIAMHVDREAVERLLANRSPMDVLVTHETATATLPLPFKSSKMSSFIKGLLGLEENEDVAGCPAFNKVLKQFQPQRYFFGHLHCFDEGIIGSTHYMCLNSLQNAWGPNPVGGTFRTVVQFPDYMEAPTHEASVHSSELVAA